MERKGHSVLGIISFCVSLIGMVLFLGLWIFISVAIKGEELILGSILILQFLFNLIGVGTGIPALFSQSKERLFPILGVVFSSCSFIITLSIMFRIGFFTS